MLNRPFILSSVLAALIGLGTATSCQDTDILDDTSPVNITGQVQTVTVDGTETLDDAEGARVEFIRDPGENTLEDRVTFVDSSGRYSLKVKMDEGRCEPVRFSLLNYYEQDHIACESDGDQTLDIVLVSAEYPPEGPTCEAICDREANCEDFFADVYETRDECLNHCRTGCRTDDYADCTYQYGDQPVNTNTTCSSIYGCFQNFCDDSWREGDDDTADDDAGDDDAGDDDTNGDDIGDNGTGDDDRDRR
jgi:hypothetical protein